jgi:hypothetical protein
MIVALACFFFGSWLGMRFKVAILVPALFATMIIVLGEGILGGQKASLVIFSEIAALGALQIGYLSAAALTVRAPRNAGYPLA